jgi:hypothetical protein
LENQEGKKAVDVIIKELKEEDGSQFYPSQS